LTAPQAAGYHNAKGRIIVGDGSPNIRISGNIFIGLLPVSAGADVTLRRLILGY